MGTTRAFAAQTASSPLGPFSLTRRGPLPSDVQIEILSCGVCHSDFHQVRDEWSDFAKTVYPCVPGHEIVGRVTKVGKDVRKFKEGDLAAVGCMVDVDVIPIQKINAAYDRLAKSDVKYRFVIDMASLQAGA